MRHEVSSSNRSQDSAAPNTVNVVRVRPIESHAAVRLVEKLTIFIGAATDERTLRGFGRRVGVSRGAFRNWCRTAGLTPRSVRDFARGLRAAWRLEREPSFCPSDVLDIIDERALRAFCLNCGGANSECPRTVEDFLKRQSFITNREFVRQVRAFLQSITFTPLS